MSASHCRTAGALIMLVATLLTFGVPSVDATILAFRETISGANLVPGLGDVEGVAVSPDGQQVYTTTPRDTDRRMVRLPEHNHRKDADMFGTLVTTCG